jgi:hypothetical protein
MESAAAFDGSDDAPVIGGGSGDVLQQEEATWKVRGELNRSGRLQRLCSLSQGRDGGGFSKSDDAGSSPIA